MFINETQSARYHDIIDDLSPVTAPVSLALYLFAALPERTVYEKLLDYVTPELIRFDEIEALMSDSPNRFSAEDTAVIRFAQYIYNGTGGQGVINDIVKYCDYPRRKAVLETMRLKLGIGKMTP